MSAIRTAALTPSEIKPIALKAVRQVLQGIEESDMSVESDVDFDGEDVVRIVLEVDHKVPARILIDATDAIHVALRARGDERFVYLNLRRQDFVEPPHDADEE